MEIRITGKNTVVTEDLKLFAERKVGKLSKFFNRGITAMVTLSEHSGKKGAKTHRAEVVVHIKGKVISAKEDTDNFFIAIDAVVEKLRRQLKKEKNKWLEKTKAVRPAAKAKKGSKKAAAAVAESATDQLELRQFRLKPMSVEEALIALKDSSQPFFLFVNDDQTINCVFEREDGGFGLMVPESTLT